MSLIPYSQGTDMSRYLGDCWRKEEAGTLRREWATTVEARVRAILADYDARPLNAAIGAICDLIDEITANGAGQ